MFQIAKTSSFPLTNVTHLNAQKKINFMDFCMSKIVMKSVRCEIYINSTLFTTF